MPQRDLDVVVGRLDIRGDHPVPAGEALGEVAQLLELEGPVHQVLVEHAAVVDEPALAVLGRAVRLVRGDERHEEVRPLRDFDARRRQLAGEVAPARDGALREELDHRAPRPFEIVVLDEVARSVELRPQTAQSDELQKHRSRTLRAANPRA